MPRAGEDGVVDDEALDDDAVGVGDLRREIGLIPGKHDFGRVEARQALLQAPAPAEEIRLVMGKEFGHRLPVRRRGRGIEHDRNDLQEMVFFDHNARHAQPRMRPE
jgi:hypothetical protein